ncbi:MAG: hypothetical protein NZ556_07405 [Fimbriimonadales bacterium]|nr:hypothetical protein [Fimbriimonadales bacterium]
MRRLIWGAAALVAIFAVGAWWTTQNAIRLERFHAERFARLSEAKQMEWLVRQVLARSKARTILPDWWERLWHANRPKLPPLVGADVFILGEVCARYNLPRLLNRVRRRRKPP